MDMLRINTNCSSTFVFSLLVLSPSRPALLTTILAFGAIYIIWGSTYTGILIAIQSIPPFFMTGFRFLVAGLLLYSYCLAKKMPAPTAKLTWQNIFAGFLMLACGTGTVTWVEQHIASGLTAILVAIAPLWYVILDKRLWHYHFSNVSIVLGLVTGMAGVILLLTDGDSLRFAGDSLSVISAFVMLVGNILWVSGSLYVKYNVVGGSPLVRASIQMLSAGVILIFAGLISGEQKVLSVDAITLESFLALLYLIVFGSLIAYLAYLWLLERWPPSIVGTHALVNPVVAVFFGWLLADEAIQDRQLVALLIILASVALVTFKKKKPVEIKA